MRLLVAVLALVLACAVTRASAQQLSCQQITALTDQYFGSNAWVMKCIAWIESRWVRRPSCAVCSSNNYQEPAVKNPSGATGLWQIMPAWCNNPACDCSTLTTPDGNAQCAVHILATQGLAAWESDPSTCQSWYNSHSWPFPTC